MLKGSLTRWIMMLPVSVIFTHVHLNIEHALTDARKHTRTRTLIRLAHGVEIMRQ
jgi:hypothetical protein